MPNPTSVSVCLQQYGWQVGHQSNTILSRGHLFLTHLQLKRLCVTSEKRRRRITFLPHRPPLGCFFNEGGNIQIMAESTDRQQHDSTTHQQIYNNSHWINGYDCNGLGHLVRKMVKYIKFCWSVCRGSTCYSQMKTNKETRTFTKTWSQHDDTAVHSCSSSFLSKSASQLCFTPTRDCHWHILGSWSNPLSALWYTVSADISKVIFHWHYGTIQSKISSNKPLFSHIDRDERSGRLCQNEARG